MGTLTCSSGNLWYPCITTNFVPGWASGSNYRYTGAASVPECGVSGVYVNGCVTSQYSFQCGNQAYCSYQPLGSSLTRTQRCR